MKNFITVLLFSISLSSLQAQFTSATLQASGLTCAMCSKAINNALQQLPFVESVSPDIKNSAFKITFKKDKSVNVDDLKLAVEDAGFSLAKLKLAGNFQQVAIKNDEHVTIGGKTFHFLKVNDQTLNGNKEITMVDKDFVSAKEFKKFTAATHMECVQTGRAASCCNKESNAQNERIYHVTI